MGCVLAICNQKGGCGKTTSAVNLAASFAKQGRKTLLIDADYQGNASSYLGLKYKAQKLDRLLSDALLSEKRLSEVILHTEHKNLDLIAADMELGRVNREKVLEPGGHALLQRLLQERNDNICYDITVIDSHPSLDLLFQNVMTAANYYILPLFPEPDSFDGLSLMFREISRIQKNLNPTLFFLGAVITRMKEKNLTHRKFAEKIRNFGTQNNMPVLGVIPESDAIARSSDLQKPIITQAPNLPISKAYHELAQFLLGELKVRRGRTPKTPDITKQQIEELANSDLFLSNEVEVTFL